MLVFQEKRSRLESLVTGRVGSGFRIVLYALKLFKIVVITDFDVALRLSPQFALAYNF